MSMSHDGVVPDVVSEWPKGTLHISFPSFQDVREGTELTKDGTQTEPTVRAQTDAGHFYSLFVLDPDAPSRNNPEMKFYCHWLVVNIPGNGTDRLNVKAGTEIASYMGPAPPAGSGPHRYCFLLYDQGPNQADVSLMEKFIGITSRAKFQKDHFLAKHYKQQLPRLYAANFFTCQVRQ